MWVLQTQLDSSRCSAASSVSLPLAAPFLTGLDESPPPKLPKRVIFPQIILERDSPAAILCFLRVRVQLTVKEKASRSQRMLLRPVRPLTIGLETHGVRSLMQPESQVARVLKRISSRFSIEHSIYFRGRHTSILLSDHAVSL